MCLNEAGEEVERKGGRRDERREERREQGRME